MHRYPCSYVVEVHICMSRTLEIIRVCETCSQRKHFEPRPNLVLNSCDLKLETPRYLLPLIDFFLFLPSTFTFTVFFNSRPFHSNSICQQMCSWEKEIWVINHLWDNLVSSAKTSNLAICHKNCFPKEKGAAVGISILKDESLPWLTGKVKRMKRRGKKDKALDKKTNAGLILKETNMMICDKEG